MKQPFAILAAKAIQLVPKKVTSGTALPGLVAEKIDPQLLGSLIKRNFPGGVVMVTGTNGKTTTARLITKLLVDSGKQVVHNRAGSNLPRGIISTLVGESSLTGRIKADMAVLEVDEGYFPQLLQLCKPQAVVITNIFRDQLDRYGEVDSIVAAFTQAFTVFQPATIIMNGDDPLVSSIAYKAKLQPEYFGINNYDGPTIKHDYVTDMVDDPATGKLLQYSQRYFGHIGIYRSINGQFQRPDLDVAAQKVVQKNANTINISVKTTSQSFNVPLPLGGAYNVYNALAAIALAQALTIPVDTVVASLSSAQAVFGRVETASYRDKSFTTMLIKNPAGFNQVIANFLAVKPAKPLLFIINDNLADGRDISWLWDSGLEDLRGYRAQVFVSGTRAQDMALRLKYAGLPSVVVVSEPSQAFERFTTELPAGGGYVLPTYTGLLWLQKYLAKHGNKENWA